MAENLISTTKSVSELIDNFESGIIAIPEIQRDVVWKSDQVKELIDSLRQGYPCGALIFWEPRERDGSLVKSMIRPERLEQHGEKLPRYFLLDGQQRVTALASVLLNREKLKSLLCEMAEEMPFIFINLRKFPREIEATTDSVGYKFPWVPFNRLFDNSLFSDPDFGKLASRETDDIRKFVQMIRDYQFPVQIIRDRDYATVGEIFTRVNSLGTPLTGAEIHLARIVPHWRGITKEFREYRKELARRNYDLDLTFLMRAITAVECQSPQIKKLAEKVSKDKPTRAHLNKTWRRAQGATDKLIRILQKDLSLDKSKYFTSKNAMVPLVYYLALGKQSGQAVHSIQRFFLLSQLSEHYGSGAETALRRDFGTLADTSVTPLQGLGELVDNVNGEARQYYRGLKIVADKIRGLPSKNVLVLLMYILMRRRGATDWGGGKVNSLDEIDPQGIQLHHIFPFNFMITNKAAYKPWAELDYSPAEYRAEVNDIANLTFISQLKNVEISDLPPWQYLPNETTKEMRKAHFIPEDRELWKTENFSKFLDERRKLISKGINSLLKYL